MLRFSVKSNFTKAQAALRGIDSLLAKNIRIALDEMSLNLVATSKSKYLSGPRPRKLGVVTNRLRSSIRAKVIERGSRFLLQFGSDVPYAKLHEKGLRVKSHSRTITQAFGRPLKSPVTFTVRSFKMPKRPFLAPAIRDETPFFKRRMFQAVKNTAQGILG